MYPPEFLIIPYQLVNDDKIQPLDETLYGVIYWLTQLKGEKCTAGNTTLAEICRTTPACVQNSLGRLEKREYVARIFKDEARKVRKEIIPLIVFTKVSLNNDRGRKVSSTDDTVSSGDDRRVSSGDDQNKSSPLNKSSNNKATKVASKDINEVIEAFNSVNPSYKKLFKNTTERKASERLILEHGKDKIIQSIKVLPQIISKPYAPKPITPYQFESDLGKIKAFISQSKGVKNKSRFIQ